MVQVLALCLAVQAAPKDTALYTELIGMAMADQEVRERFVQAMKDKKPFDPLVIREMNQVDAANRARLKQIIKEKGWPTYSMVGKEAAEDAWLMAQHSDRDVAFQEEVLRILAPLVAKGEASKQNYAYLWDRIAMNRHRKQLYGTQGNVINGEWVMVATEDPKNLDKRRASVGLPPMSVYFKMLEREYGIKPAGKGEKHGPDGA